VEDFHGFYKVSLFQDMALLLQSLRNEETTFVTKKRFSSLFFIEERT
jgi:hypothetical protein